MKFLAPSLCALSLAPATVSADNPVLQVSFGTATVTVAPDTATRRQLPLPTLDYAFNVVMECLAPARPTRLSISIADTSMVFELAQDAEHSNISETLQVPAAQLGPLVTDGFCIEGEDETHREVLVDGALTSSVSLRCTSDSSESIHYASEPLTLRIECDSAGDYAESSTDR